MKRSMNSTLALAAFVALAAGCSMNKAKQGAVPSAGSGGAAGAVFGNATGSTVRGAIIGAAVGGEAGGVIGRQMDVQARELAYEMPLATVQRVGEGITVVFPEGALFDTSSDGMVKGARDNMRRFAASLVKYGGTRTMIVGHTDSQGTTEQNAEVSERRARSAADFLAAQGIDRSRLGTAGRGATEPIAGNDTADGRRRNRRVEVAIFADEATRTSGH